MGVLMIEFLTAFQFFSDLISYLAFGTSFYGIQKIYLFIMINQN